MNSPTARRRSLIITGMHRSYTSLVARAFHDAGLFLGDNLIGPASSNPYGHYESREIYDFHRSLMHQHQLNSWWNYINVDKAGKLAGSDLFKDAAREILDIHFPQIQFGWKEPMASFFMYGWLEVLPDPHLVIVFRHPIACVASLMKRTTGNKLLRRRPMMAIRWFNLWDQTNLKLLDFLEEAPEKCILINAPNDLRHLTTVNDLNQKIIGQWKISIQPLDFRSIIDQDLLKNSGVYSGYLLWLFQRRKRTIGIYNKLLKRAQDQRG